MKAFAPLCFALLLAACAGAPPSLPQHSFDVRAVAQTPSAATRTLADPQGRAVLVDLHPTLTQRDVQQAELASVEGGQPAVQVRFSAEGARRLADLTAEPRGHCLAVVIDGQLRSVVTVQQPVLDGRVLLNGFATPREAQILVRQLNALRQAPVTSEQR
ncbi:MAG: Protein translocase subunit SecDF [Stenotrophomonas maltophilia]|nr:MAG: Protein translocase subunit SecDF [Stenotrophomonas maltophilia]